MLSVRYEKFRATVEEATTASEGTASDMRAALDDCLSLGSEHEVNPTQYPYTIMCNRAVAEGMAAFYDGCSIDHQALQNVVNGIIFNHEDSSVAQDRTSANR